MPRVASVLVKVITVCIILSHIFGNCNNLYLWDYVVEKRVKRYFYAKGPI